MNKIRLLTTTSLALMLISFNAFSASMNASSNVGNSASWPSANDTYLKQLQADLIKKAEDGFYGGYDYNTNYYSQSYSYSSSVTFDIGSINIDQGHNKHDQGGCGNGGEGQGPEILCNEGNVE